MNIQQQIAMNEFTQKCIRRIVRTIKMKEFIKNYGDISLMLVAVVFFAIVVK